MYEIIKIYTQNIPEMRYIGKKYSDTDRVNSSFGSQWDKWFEKGWFALIEQAAGGEEKCHSLYEDGDAYIGMMRYKDGEPFEYWIGMFVPPGTDVPEGFNNIDFDDSHLGVCWLYGKMNELFGHECECAQSLENNGYKIKTDSNGAYRFFERYGCPRFTTPDDNGNIVLDICHYIV